MDRARKEGQPERAGIGESGVTYEADPRHAEIFVEALELQSAKPVTNPGWKEEVEEGELLEGEER